MDIKDYWGVDSSPGSARDTTEKCGNLFATMGATGSATIAAYSTDLADRATVTPGTHPTINTGAATPAGAKEPWTITPASAARGASLGFNAKGTTYFDSFAAMFGLPVFNTASDKLSLSFWISPDGEAQGSILCSPWQEILGKPANSCVDPVVAPNDLLDAYLRIGPYAGEGIPTLGGGTEKHFLDEATVISGPMIVTNAFLGTQSFNVRTSGSLVTVPDPSYSSGSDGVWFHVMFSMHATSGRVYCTLAVNDTVILDGTSPVTSDLSASITNEPCLFPYGSFTPVGTNPAATKIPALRDDAPQNSAGTVGGANVWTIGGAYQDPTAGSGASILPEGDGLYGAVTELWIAEGQYVDWTLSANRNKFHTTDILGNVFLPTDLGAHGQTPTGSRPTMYFTGIPDNFIVNRVNGVKCNVYKGTRNSLTLDGRYPGAL